MDFASWLFLESVQTYIRSRKETSPKNPANTFLVLYGADQEERELMFSKKEALKRIGFRYFGANGTYSLFSTKITPEVRSELGSLGVDLSGYDSPPESPREPATPATDPVGASKADETLDKMSSELEKIMPEDAKAKDLIESIEKWIDYVANQTDEAAKQSFIRNFLDFSSKFYNYSFHNQMLIWMQTRGQARYVSSPKKWEQEFGRTVKDWGSGISILAPRPFKEKKNALTGEKEAREGMYFISVKVYDVSATEPIPGHPKKFEPISRKDWSLDSNEDVEGVNSLIKAIEEWIRGKGIELTYEEMSPEQGGYSAGGKIAVNKDFRGINKFSTLVHEAAHEILHWKDPEGKQSSKRDKEIDAEPTASVVLQHFGFPTKDTPNYLALFRAKGDDVRARKKNIHKAAAEIINGIKEKMETQPVKGEEETSDTV